MRFGKGEEKSVDTKKTYQFVLAPDSFKGTLDAVEVCNAMRQGILRACPGSVVHCVPVADGGEGTVEAFLAAVEGKRKEISVQGPFGDQMKAGYALLDDGKTAVIEMASCAGLPLAEGRMNPELASTYGVGQLLLDAVNSGCGKIILGLGGSCTNDGGAGALAAAGAQFFRKDGSAFVPAGATLDQIEKIDLAGLRKRFSGVEIIAMCDIDNPLYGETGAAYVFAPQKGADKQMVKRLDEKLRRLAETAEKALGKDFSQIPGAGAAGGMGFGMTAFLGAKLEPGIETVLNTVGFDSLLSRADLVFTGEGRLDSQSARGKVISGVSRRCKQAGVPAAALAGELGEGFETLYEMGLSAAFSINRAPLPFSEAAPRTAENLALAAENAVRLFLSHSAL